MAFQRFKSLGATLGSFGRSIISRVQKAAGTILDVLGITREVGIDISVPEVTREWGQVSIAGERQEQFSALGPHQGVPVDWFEESEIPWDKPLAYKVSVYGRDLATGRFTRQELDITVSRPLTSEEALDEAAVRVGIEGTSPTFNIFSISLIGASRRAGEEWRW